jgi:hypothetical protein
MVPLHSAMTLNAYAECHCDECHMLNVTIKSIVLNVIILNVVEPLKWTRIPCVFIAQGNTKRIDKMPCEIERVNES